MPVLNDFLMNTHSVLIKYKHLVQIKLPGTLYHKKVKTFWTCHIHMTTDTCMFVIDHWCPVLFLTRPTLPITETRQLLSTVL